MRKTPLRSVTPLRRKAWIRGAATVTNLWPRSAPIPARRGRHAATDRPVERTTAAEWEELRTGLWDRCGGHCEACDGRLSDLPAWEAHHCLLDGQGGADTLANLVAVHPRCHTLSRWAIHTNPAWAIYVRGLLVPSWADPANVPMVLPDGRRVLRYADFPTYLDAGPVPEGCCPAPIHADERLPVVADVPGMFIDLHRERVQTSTAYCHWCALPLARAGWFVPVGGDAA